ncbi:hypothetical protein Q31b_57490 [Novipirellula aureliae]|uniref:Uncharacterized protein n=1 Tax=Novipirellula aureliae TaxID=2527966 RepID=A0A5C6D904_9BACT|nr:hypothetical protein Q31b_57490 [Novipirellula aureliae]
MNLTYLLCLTCARIRELVVPKEIRLTKLTRLIIRYRIDK